MAHISTESKTSFIWKDRSNITRPYFQPANKLGAGVKAPALDVTPSGRGPKPTVRNGYCYCQL